MKAGIIVTSSPHPLDKKPRRILIKLSGEILAGKTTRNFDPNTIRHIASEIALIHKKNIAIAIVCGGGNIFRGKDQQNLPGLKRIRADRIGMLATAINAIILENALKEQGITCDIFSALPLGGVCESFELQKASQSLDKNHIVIFAGGTGNPLFTTDTAAVLRSCELDCDLMIKGTKTDGIYDQDPEKNPQAKKINQITHQQAIEKKIKIMDQTAFHLADDNALPIIVCSMTGNRPFHNIIDKSYPHTVIYKSGKTNNARC